MSVLIVLGSIVLVGLFVARRRHRKENLAGLNGERPTFTVEPPHRRMGSRRTEML